MDRTQAFVEYGRILQDLDDSLNGGFRRPAATLEVHPPQMLQGSPAETETIQPAEMNPYTGQVLGDSPAQSGQILPEISTSKFVSQESFLDQQQSQVISAVEPVSTVLPEASGELAGIATEISNCRNCNLYLLREQTVPGVGLPGATLMIVTQAPTDMAGALSSPLAAYEHEYMEKWLTALGLDPGRDVFITPSVKCRTPGGRPPGQDESAACSGYLRRQYKAVAPRAILALGASACGALTGNPADFPSLVGKDWTWGAIPALVLWTPAEVLANPGRLRKPVWNALQQLKASWNAIPGNQL